MYKLIFLTLTGIMIALNAFAQPFFLQQKPLSGANKESSFHATVLSPAEINDQVSQTIARQQSSFDKDFNQKMIQLKQQLKSSPTDTQSPQIPQSTAYNPDNNPQPATAPPPRKEIYTGFGATTEGNKTNSGSTAQPSPRPPQNSGGNWNIRY